CADLLVPLPLGEGGVDQAPFDSRVAAVALGLGGEQIGPVLADVALVDHAGEATGAGQDPQQGDLGQGDGGGAVVDEDDDVAGESQLVASAGRGAVEGRDPGLTGVLGRVL